MNKKTYYPLNIDNKYGTYYYTIKHTIEKREWTAKRMRCTFYHLYNEDLECVEVICNEEGQWYSLIDNYKAIKEEVKLKWKEELIIEMLWKALISSITLPKVY